jgi:hypothetical protein
MGIILCHATNEGVATGQAVVRCQKIKARCGFIISSPEVRKENALTTDCTKIEMRMGDAEKDFYAK